MGVHTAVKTFRLHPRVAFKLLKKALSEAGFAVRWLGTFGDPYKGMKWLSRTRLLALLVAALSPEEPKRLAGEILVLLAQKTSDSDSEP